jgi:hypothetical protein
MRGIHGLAPIGSFLQTFLKDDVTDGDHVPPRSACNPRDHEPALKLQTHRRCNASYSVDDKKVAWTGSPIRPAYQSTLIFYIAHPTHFAGCVREERYR